MRRAVRWCWWLSPWAAVALLGGVGAGCAAGQGAYRYPEAPRGAVVDVYHGVEVADPYRWLEDADSAETRRWVAAQNALFRGFVATPARARILERLTALRDYPRYSAPIREGGRTFFFKNDGLQNHAVLWLQTGPEAEPRLVLDPNSWSEDGTVALTGLAISRDGRKLAYARSTGGSDWQQIRVRDIDSGRDLDEVLRWAKFSSMAFVPDGSGFYYNRYPDQSGLPAAEQNTHNKVYYHALGTPQSADELVFEQPDAPLRLFIPEVSEDGRYLILSVHEGTDPDNRLYYRRLDCDGDFVRLLDAADASYSFIESSDDTFYLRTDRDAPRGRIVAVDLQQPQPEHWREVLAQPDDEVIEFARLVGDALVVGSMRDASSRLRIHDTAGALLAQVELPGIGSVHGVSGKRRDEDFFFVYSSFLQPATIYRYDLTRGQAGAGDGGRAEVFREPALRFSPGDYVTEQVFFDSADGTRVPMFITQRRDLARDGHNPTLLYGYGGFNVSLTPYFSPRRILWLEQGGVFAVANLRGGGEYGEQWHQAGVLDRKQNVFDDFIAAAETLIERGYTRRERLAIEGGSNGGLLVAASMVQRPDLFGAVLCRVPVIDMLRYHTFTVGKFWVSDYGNAEQSREHFDFLYAYSPLHNIRPGQRYPAALITTADTDDRVVPAHGKKFAAALQAADAGQQPILLRVETQAGHGGGKPTSKRIEESADIYAFLFEVFGMQYTPAGS